MRTRNGVVVTLSLALAFIIAGVLYAQKSKEGTQKGGMMGMMSMMKDCPMMGAMAQGPKAALEHQKELGLSEAQVKRLQGLAEQAEPAHARTMQQMQALHEEIRRATSGDQFNEAAVRAAFDRMGSLHTEMGMSMLRAQHQARQVLSAEQREKLSKMGGGMMGMHGMMGGMMGGGMMGGGMMGGMDMENCPMMKGGMKGKGMMQGMQDSSAHRMHPQKQI